MENLLRAPTNPAFGCRGSEYDGVRISQFAKRVEKSVSSSKLTNTGSETSAFSFKKFQGVKVYTVDLGIYVTAWLSLQGLTVIYLKVGLEPDFQV
jgi:hypothetical protein